jgi:hypothetical protein
VNRSRHDYELKRAYALIERIVARYSEDEKREMFQVGGLGTDAVRELTREEQCLTQRLG